MVYDKHSLFPHKSVFENLAYPLRIRRMSEAQMRERIAQIAATLQIEPLMDRYPAQLSGGQQQRVAIGRALVRDASCYLLDEPISHLDAKLRARMRVEFKRLQREFQATMLYVSHDQLEAMTMADRIVVMHDGIIEQMGTPLELFDQPRNLFVAQFIGSPAMNLIQGTVGPQGLAALGQTWPLPPSHGLSSGRALHYGIRPTDLVLADQGVPAQVIVIEPTGAETELLVQVGDQRLTVVTHGRSMVRPDEVVHLGIATDKVHLFDGNTGERI